jgi:tetratricopeptide (TPR) repeat protein
MKGFRQSPGGSSQLERTFQQAVRWHTAGRLGEAAEFFAAILKRNPAHFVSLHRLAAIRRQQGHLEESLALLKTAIRYNPRSADAHNSLGNTLEALRRHAEAIDCFRHALALRPDYPEAHNNMGNSFQAVGRNEEAAACYREAVALRPEYVAAHSNLGNALTLLRRPEQAIPSFETALALNPRLGPAHSNLGNALMALNRHREASQAFSRARELDPDLPQPRLNQAIAKLALGDYAAGWPDFEARRHNRERRFPQPQWDGRSEIAGKTILVHFEQGLGDTIQFARYAALVAERGAHVVFEVQKPLFRLFDRLTGPEKVIAEGDPLPEFDFHVPLLSLPLAFGTTREIIPSPGPYLHATGTANSGIGLCWAGNPGYANDHNRSIPLALLRPLLDIPKTRFISLQKNFRPGDEEILKGRDNLDVQSDRQGEDFADTAALVAGMDLVITVDTAVAHLAGALGRPVWILLPFSAHWAWLRERADSPWYPTARLFRQPKIGDWESVVAQVAAALTERFCAARKE